MEVIDQPFKWINMHCKIISKNNFRKINIKIRGNQFHIKVGQGQISNQTTAKRN